MEDSPKTRLMTRELLNTAALDREVEAERVVPLLDDALTAETALVTTGGFAHRH
jgi:hypothetical protein